MNEQIAVVIDKLSDKLGVTAVHLWGVLVKQAPIYAVTTLIECLVVFWLTYLLWRTTLTKIKLYGDNFGESDKAITTAMVLAAMWVVALVLNIGAFVSIPKVVTALLNPEYWALSQILKL